MGKPQATVPILDFIYFDAGGGHRASAEALREGIVRAGKPWTIRMVNLQEVLDPIDSVRKLTGARLQDVYNNVLRRGWTLGSPQMLRVLSALIQSYHGSSVRLLAEHWGSAASARSGTLNRPALRELPDMVVSFVPHFNRALLQGLRQADSHAPFVTILTDLADYPPHFWMERQEQVFICGTEQAMEQGRSLGLGEGNLWRSSGMIIHPRFYDSIEMDIGEERQALGLQPHCLTGLVMFGGLGSKDMLVIERELAKTSLPVQLIYICGKNPKLKQRLEQEPRRHPRFIEGFTAKIPYYMRLADFFVGKPGPGSLSEAMAMNLPVVVESNSWTLPQERYNAEWIEAKQVGLVVKNIRSIGSVVARLQDPPTLEQMKRNVAGVCNQAVFEIPELLARLLPSGLT